MITASKTPTFPAVRLGQPAVILAPMEGLSDAPMRGVQGEIGAFTFAVAEFLRVSGQVPPRSVFYRAVPELHNSARTDCGLPVQVQILGGHAERMGQSAQVACRAGATAIDINFGCPAPTVNNHDGGAALLRHPKRIKEIVAAVRTAVPADIPVSAKLRLGWDSTDAIFENATMAAEGGATWLTIHARTRQQAYKPPVYWRQIGKVRELLPHLPIVANGDIWTPDDFRRCREETGCDHFMLGRGGLANPFLSHWIAHELGIIETFPFPQNTVFAGNLSLDWRPYLQKLIDRSNSDAPRSSGYVVSRLKQWLNIARTCGSFTGFETIKRAESVEELFALLSCVESEPQPKAVTKFH